MKAPEAYTLDFETFGIEARPEYPPVPVGLSVKGFEFKKPQYFAWGHATENNCDKKTAARVLKKIWYSNKPMVFQHAKFDVDVAQIHFDLPEVDWQRIHDTLYLIFFHDPHAKSLSLKPAAEAILGIKPKERDILEDWIVKNVPEAKKKPSTWGAYIQRAPGGLTGRYANGDVDRTDRLYKYLLPRIAEAGMLEAYDRERQLMPIFLASEREGMRVNLAALKKDIKIYEKQRTRAEAWLRNKLNIKASDFNFDADEDVGDVLHKNKAVKKWVMTPGGSRSVAKKNLTIDQFRDKKLFLALNYRNKLQTCLGHFMEPWLEKGTRNDGYIMPNWNQVRQPKGSDDSKGTRTGRPSCDNPNFLNVSKDFEINRDGFTHPTFIRGLEHLPLVRKYALPDEGEVWLHRDFNQQELRILAHFEDGPIMQAYLEDPTLDLHQFVKDEIMRISHRDIDRTSVKTMNFGKIYGMGLGALATSLRTSVAETKAIRDTQDAAMPSLPEMEKAIKELAKAGLPIVTWGGRVYYVEKPTYVKKYKRVMTFEYKLLNYLVQGSAADATKEALIRYHNAAGKSRFLVTVYDEINISAPKSALKKEMKTLKDCMESLEFDVPLKSDGKIGPNWGSLQKYKE